MKIDMILAGVGGQGILSLAFVLDNTALEQGYAFKQSEVHGMAQMGGAVQSHLRLSDTTIHSDLVSKGSADLIVAIEPVESLRYIEYLSPEGLVLTNREPLVNIDDYPDLDEVIASIEQVPRHELIDAATLAKEAGNKRAQNMVMLGAASKYLPMLDPTIMEKYVEVLFKAKGDRIIDINIDAFRRGRDAASGEA